MHINSVVSILSTYSNAIFYLCSAFICVIILQAEINARVQPCVTCFCHVFVNAVFGGVSQNAHKLAAVQRGNVDHVTLG